jgi:tetratricopeptide (TPR) repeat protein
MRNPSIAIGAVVIVLAAEALAVSPSDLRKQAQNRARPQAGATPSLSGRGAGQSASAAAISRAQQQIADAQAAQRNRLQQRQQKPSIVGDRPTQATNRPGGQRSDTAGGLRSGGSQGLVIGTPDVVPYDPTNPRGNRPGGNRRPGNWPADRRPGGYGRPDIDVNRPDVDIDVNRPVVVNRPITVNNNNTVINQNIVNQQINNRTSNNRRRYDNYNADLHYHWQPATWSASYRPSYSNYYSRTSSGGWMGSPGYAYVNPFYTRPATPVADTWADYSQPIHVPDASYHETDRDLINSERAIQMFDAARADFRIGEYRSAWRRVDDALRALPNDPTLHQFRALALFAQQRYQDAAATLYSVLAVSPGWDWETLSRMYGDLNAYQAQLRELEQYVAANPRASDARFLLAYHYLVWGESAAAWRQLAVLRDASPQDQIVLGLMQAVRDTQ